MLQQKKIDSGMSVLHVDTEVPTSDSFNFSASYVTNCYIHIQGKICLEIPPVLHLLGFYNTCR